MPLWLEVFAATGPWAGAILALVFYLHTQGTAARAQLREDIEIQITRLAAETRSEHASVRAQVADIARSISDNYVQVREFTSSMYSVNEAITETRKDIGRMANRLDDTIRDQSHLRPHTSRRPAGD